MKKIDVTEHKDILEKVRDRERDDAYRKQVARESKLRELYNERVDTINKSHAKEVSELHEFYKEQLKNEAQARLTKYKKIVEQRDIIIEDLTKRNKILRTKLKQYIKAYENYTYLRDHIHTIVDKFRIASDTVALRGAEISGTMNELFDMISMHRRKMPALEDKMVETMGVRDTLEKPETQLRLIENK